MKKPGELIKGRYQILDIIDQTGRSHVYRVFDQAKNREAALKILDSQATGDAEALKRFINAGEVLSQIRHRAVVTFYSLELEGRVPFLVMELIEGKRMADIKDELRQDLPTLFHHFLELLEGIEECHLHQTVHRNIQPANLLITPEGQLKIIDFGFAKTRENITQPGTILGTPIYMSPEQCMGLKVTESADIYSIGVVFWEFLIGRPPFEIDPTRSVSLIQLIEIMDKPLPMERWDGLPRLAPLKGIIHSMLGKDPETRPSLRQVIATIKKEIPNILAQPAS